MSESNQPRIARPGGVFLGHDLRLRPIWRALLYLVAAVMVMLLAGILAGGFAALLSPAAAEKLAARELLPRWWLALQYALWNAGLVVLAWLFLRALDGRDWRSLGLWFYPGWLREAALGLALGAALIGAMAAALAAGGWVVFAARAAPHAEPLLATTAMLLVAATFEELLLRGYAFQRLVDALGAAGAVLLTSALFGALHIPNPSATALSTANTALAGILMAVAYLKTRGLWLPIGLHFAWNFVMGPVLGMPVSGMDFGGLWSAALREPAWISGGAYGPEGGLVATAAAAAAALWLGRTRAITPSPAMREVLE